MAVFKGIQDEQAGRTGGQPGRSTRTANQ